MVITQLEANLYGGDRAFAELMAGMSILSDVQFFINDCGADFDINALINHAKHHIGNAMVIIHQEKNLPGEVIIQEAKDHG